MHRNGQTSDFVATSPPPSYEASQRFLQPAENPDFHGTVNDLEYILPQNDASSAMTRGRWKMEIACGEKKTTLIGLALVFAIVLTVAIACLTTFYVMVAYGHLKQYGEKCNPSVPMSCGTTDLTCLNGGICGCKSADYEWDQKQGLCLALVNTDAECRKWGWDGQYAVPCTANAVCNSDHRCECLNYFVEIGHECIASYDGICKTTKDCNQLEFLWCGQSGKCECRPGTMRKQRGNVFGCFVKIGESCAGVMRDRCVDPNSECSENQVCLCNKDKGYVPSRENTSCGKTVNNTCNADRDCADTLSCVKTVIEDLVGVCYCRDTSQRDNGKLLR